MNNSLPTYFLVDDHSLLLEGLKTYLSTEFPTWKYQGHARCLSTAQQEIKNAKPSLIFLDHQIGSDTGVSLIKLTSEHTSASDFILISQLDSKNILKEYLQLGVLGFVSKKDDQDEIKKAINHITTSGEVYFSPTFQELIHTLSSADILTQREIAVVQLIAKGLTNKDVGKELSCSEFTIKTHKTNIMRKLNVSNSVEICNWALKNNLL